ncbi:MAG: ROK family protein [Candidatus Dormibacteria bacterium]
MRSLNERTILERLRRGGPASRPRLAEETGLSRPTVGAVLTVLERAGLVRAVGPSRQQRGRSALIFEHLPGDGHVVGVDVGHGWLRCSVADLSGTVVARRDIRNAARSAPNLVRMVSTLARGVARSAGVGWPEVAWTVVGSPGVFDPRDGTLLLSSRLRRWGRPGLLDSLRSELGDRTSVANDANLAALGELRSGWGATFDNFVYLMVGTGLGMGIIVNGKLQVGLRGAAGEVAYLPFGDEATARPPVSGTRWGAFEETVSARGVVQAAVELGMSSRLSARQVFDAARRGVAPARATVEGEAERLALVIAAVTAVLDPEAVVMGGGIGGELELLREPLEARLQQLTPFRPRIVSSELGNEGVLRGAIALALELARDDQESDRPHVPAPDGTPESAGIGELRQDSTTSSRSSTARAPAAAPRTPATLPRAATTSSGPGPRLSR